MVANFIYDIVKALKYLHLMDPPIIHRDIKPENILIKNKVLQIADFGWSNQNANKDFRNTFCGTPDYLAPEMIMGIGHNDKLDMWTVGILMYELIHGKPPFTPKIKKKNKRAQQRAIEKNILEGNIEFSPTISKECKDIMIALLNGNQELRPNSTQILNFPFLKKQKQGVNVKATKNSEKLINSNLALENENKELKKKLEILENKLRDQNSIQESLKIKITELKKNNSKREQVNNNSSFEIQNFKQIGDTGIFNKLKYRAPTVRDRTVNKEIEKLKKSENKLKLELESFKKKNFNLNLKFTSLEKSLNNFKDLNINFFNKHQLLAKIISDSYNTNILKRNISIHQETKLDFEDILKKLKTILNEFKLLKNNKSSSSIKIIQNNSLVKSFHSKKGNYNQAVKFRLNL